MKRPVILAILGVLLLLLALLLAYLNGLFDARDAAPPPPPATSAPPPAAAPPPATVERTPVRPSFDVVRIDPDGNTVMAGKAAPDADIVIRDGDTEVGRVKADRRGEWVFLPQEPLPPGARQLTAHATNPDGSTADSGQSVVLVVPESTADPTLALRTGEDGAPSRLLQGAAPLADGRTLAIDTVDYDEQGRLSITGRAPTGGRVMVYLDNAHIGEATADGDDFWSLEPAEARASEGAHVLRGDLLGADGKVIARVEMPFTRIEVAAMPDGIRVVVQPGNSLWLLARRAYGEGLAYTVIYDANKGQIRDPDLIYPGQVFVIPRQP